MAKATASRTRRPKPGTARNAPKGSAGSVRIRMYRQGLGDCFLLTFTVDGLEKHMLIDCGTLGAKTTGVSLADVVADIRATTNDHLDLMIATHEHWDHVRGFYDRVEEFKKIGVR